MCCGMGKRSKGLNVNEDINEEVKSSYAELKKKLDQTKEECRILRLILQDTQTQHEDKCQRLRLELDDTNRQKKTCRSPIDGDVPCVAGYACKTI